MNEYLLFLAKTLTIFIACVALLFSFLLILLIRKKATPSDGTLSLLPLSERWLEQKESFSRLLLQNKADKKAFKDVQKKLKDRKNLEKRLFVYRFQGDIKASATEGLKAMVSAFIHIARPGDECCVLVESTGGYVHSYGLAASELARIRQAGFTLTVIVDRVAASGGYLMACVADRIVAAPFAIIGSIGVVAQIPNLHRFLKKNDIDIEMHTAGKHKRTLTILGENTAEGRDKFIEDLQITHALFKQFISQHRPMLEPLIEALATGEYWYGKSALDKSLIDAIGTSDDYLLAQLDNAHIFEFNYAQPKSFLAKMLQQGRALFMPATGLLSIK
jgi:serine protease SohB